MLRYPIEIVPYDPGWPQEYERERKRLEAAVGNRVLCFEHMGSTSVPGLEAKPIIDISAALSNLEDSAALMPTLEDLGYECVPVREGKRCDLWHRDRQERPRHILHLMELESEDWIRPLIFRDILRRDPDTCEQYAELKRSLAIAAGDDIVRYGIAKTEFVNRIVDTEIARRAAESGKQS